MATTFNENEAFEMHKAAVMRDFVAKPRLGKMGKTEISLSKSETYIKEEKKNDKEIDG